MGISEGLMRAPGTGRQKRKESTPCHHSSALNPIMEDDKAVPHGRTGVGRALLWVNAAAAADRRGGSDKSTGEAVLCD